MLTALQIATIQALPGIGYKTARKILSYIYHPISRISDLYEALLKTGKKDISISILQHSFEEQEQIFNEFEKENITVITQSDPKYPKLLKTLSDPPLLLYVKGNINSY